MTDARKIALYDQFSRVAKALANPVRLVLLDLVTQGERSVEELAEAAGMKVGNTSAQLKILAAAGLVSSRRSSVRVLYRLADEQVAALVEQMQAVAAARIPGVPAAVQTYLGDVEDLAPVSRGELVRLLAAGEVLVVDVRPAAEYEAGHIEGAFSLPNDELLGRLSDLPSGVDVIAYCRGQYCVLAPEAVRALRRHGFSARVYAEGMPQWRRAGLPVARGAAPGSEAPAQLDVAS